MENKLHDGFFYVRSGIEYTKVKCLGEKEYLRFNTRIIIVIYYLTEKNVNVQLTTYKFGYLYEHSNT